MTPEVLCGLCMLSRLLWRREVALRWRTRAQVSGSLHVHASNSV